MQSTAHRISGALAALTLSALLCAPAATAQSAGSAEQPAQLSAEESKYVEWARALWESFDRRTGEVKLPGGVATLNVPDDFYYLPPGDAEKVLVEVWGNPPGQNTLGMLFPARYTPFHQSAWGVTIRYEEDGHVEDDDADSIDYDDLLEQMREDTRLDNEQRARNGFKPIELVGWAAKPFYDSQAKKLHWAKELQFAEEPEHTLNYNIRVLGRKGVLVMNFIANMSQFGEVQENVGSVLTLAAFDPGFKYDEFNPDLDTVAAYGIGGLVAGKVLAKTGLLAVALVFLKKFWFIGVFVIIGLFKMLSRRGEKPIT